MRSHRASLLALSSFALLTITAAHAQTERETVEAMQTKASLACPDYSTDRGNATIAHLPIDSLRVLAKHNVVLCPDRRLKGEHAVAWYPELGALVWTPANPGAAAALALVAQRFTKTEDFPQGLEVYNAKGEPLKNQIVPTFDFKPTYRQ